MMFILDSMNERQCPARTAAPWNSLVSGYVLQSLVRMVSRWHLPDCGGKVLRTFTIITTYANEIIGELHDRMPVILEPPDWPTWLGEVEGNPVALMRPIGEDVLKVWPVGKQVNSPRNNGAELLEARE
jgi:putative SOS response-associated peptidase YedK